MLARRVREQIEALLPARLGALARFMGAQRKAVQQALRARARRPFWERDRAAASSARACWRAMRPARAPRFERELHASHASPARAPPPPLGEVYLIGAGPGDPDLLTLRALQLLQQADVILYDRLVARGGAASARAATRSAYSSARKPATAGTQERIHALLVQLRAGTASAWRA